MESSPDTAVVDADFGLDVRVVIDNALRRMRVHPNFPDILHQPGRHGVGPDGAVDGRLTVVPVKPQRGEFWVPKSAR